MFWNQNWRIALFDLLFLLALGLLLWFCVDIDIAARWVEGGAP